MTQHNENRGPIPEQPTDAKTPAKLPAWAQQTLVEETRSQPWKEQNQVKDDADFANGEDVIHVPEEAVRVLGHRTSSDHGIPSTHELGIRPKGSDNASSSGSRDLNVDEGSDYQHDAWRRVLDQKRAELKLRAKDHKKHGILLGLENGNADQGGQDPVTAENFLQVLTAKYNQHGVAKRMRHVRDMFASVEPFIAAVTTLAQTERSAALVWGSLCLIFQSVLRFANFWEEMRRMFRELADDLPRIHEYAQILHTPRLHDALRAVYATFIDICLMTADCLEADKCYALMLIEWSSFNSTFTRKCGELRGMTQDFDKEVNLARTKEESEHHKDIMKALQNAGLSAGNPITNITVPQNPKFTGRDETLAQLRTCLESRYEQQNQGAPDQGEADEDQEPDLVKSTRSCLIHGLGGLGKTETALEYTYRFRRDYSHIFWLPSENHGLLQEAFQRVLEKLPISQNRRTGSLPMTKKVEMVREWLQSTESKWLLIFDNCVQASTLQDFWPAGGQGAIIITSQNPLVGHMTNNSIALTPLLPSQGKKLIQRYLGRGDSEQKDAEQLSRSLGGLPLAIVHFVGYVARTQCPIRDINRSLDQRMHSSQIWRNSNAGISSDTRSYQLTLDTVWDLALQRLTPDARELLDLLALLDPDQVPTSLFLGDSGDVATLDASDTKWQPWSTNRFNSAVELLYERHLVERYALADGDFLRTHRALQRCILHRLDDDIDMRDRRFSQVTKILRNAVPVFNTIKRSDETQYSQFAASLPQVTAFHDIFKQSESQPQGTFELTSIFVDIAYYTFAQENPHLGEPFLSTGEAICRDLTESSPEKARSMLADILSQSHNYILGWGPEGMQTAIDLSSQVVEIRRWEKAAVPKEEDMTETQIVNYARAVTDHACCLCWADRIDEAAPLFAESIEIYTRLNNIIRKAHASTFRLYVYSARHMVTETRELGRWALDQIVAQAGDENPVTTPAKFRVAQALYVIGDVRQAHDLHKEAFEKRSSTLGDDHHTTLASRYCLGVCQQQLGMLEEAEESFRDILTRREADRDWRQADIGRVQLRLSTILKTQNRTGEAKRLQLDAVQSLGHTSQVGEKTDAVLLKELDYLVALSHGRTTGIWSNGNF
ncbi:hypothetical protein PFICI_08740 [Pestalotiopsis fici W106-1]|uniref:Uncharacterized protein n=1 Tax=Pestalotiopsis fici (strain W106-1 / CGMCC3.15140) TaxID=1229662 RepID=W3X0J5_PESFW|nr:uncharacterized protein PFICI_08740 [Pestalotiopsis fici W106-1]ETS78887.1 hypothetical protein PFICI_08740 [Pestalotiopsis fici W106-1]